MDWKEIKEELAGIVDGEMIEYEDVLVITAMGFTHEQMMKIISVAKRHGMQTGFDISESGSSMVIKIIDMNIGDYDEDLKKVIDWVQDAICADIDMDWSGIAISGDVFVYAEERDVKIGVYFKDDKFRIHLINVSSDFSY